MERRKNIWEFSPSERANLQTAIKDYINSPGVVDWHKQNHELHTSGYFFLAGHRQYLEGLESFLRSAGKLGDQEKGASFPLEKLLLERPQTTYGKDRILWA